MYASGERLIHKVLECRINPYTHQWEVLVQWIGLDTSENSSEPARILLEDVPAFFKKWVASEPKSEALRNFSHTESSEK